MRKLWLLVLLSFFTFQISNAQKPKKPTTSEIYHELEKLNFLGTALYVAAHPDDENTRLISYLSNHVKARTAYISLTRGDGGQNMIGSELKELLGVLRTQELLAARNVDGGEQWFTRAVDFGFSKHPDETFEIWDKEDVLGDVVWAIRNLKPDVIINRFDHRTPGTTHGHHTASAMLSVDAYDLAGSPDAYPNQLKNTQLWQPKRVFFNTSWWFYGSRENFEKADKSNMLSFDIGTYYPNLGVSNNEIASLASSQHLCQGFGRITTRGSQMEYIELLKGDLPEDKTNIFEGVNTTWSRIKGGDAIGKILYTIQEDFDFKNPASHVPELTKAYALLQNIEDEHWKRLKLKHLEEIILACAGIYIEATTKQGTTYGGEKVTMNIEALNRNADGVTLNMVKIVDGKEQLSPNLSLLKNKKENLTLDFIVPADKANSNPYWLNSEGTLGSYAISKQTLIGKPETPAAFEVLFDIAIGDIAFTVKKPLVYRYSKPDKGELYEPFVVLPKVSSSFKDDVYIFADGEATTIPVAIKTAKDSVQGQVQLSLPKGWMASPQSQSFSIPKKGQELIVNFTVTPPANESEGSVSSIVQVENETFDKSLIEIDYNHIPKQTVLLPSKAKIVRLNIQKKGEHIGYIVGAGDKVPESLKQIGYTVHTIDAASIQEGSLDKYDGIVVGIRAYNVNEALKLKQDYLLEYVKNGGNLVIQYNTFGRWGFKMENLAPYKLELSRDRVTDENADVTIIAKDHDLINFPNKITTKDFDGWVQERGLYFPKAWGEEFTPILSMNDKGEDSKQGSLLVASYGKGNYIYTGLSFFRELPAGVSGAYKLFANMLSIGKENIQTDDIKG